MIGRGRTDRGSHRVAESVTPSCVKTGTATRPSLYNPIVHRPVLRNLNRLRFLGPQRICDVLTSQPATEPVHNADFVEAEAVYPVLLIKKPPIVDQKLLDVIIPVREHLSAGPPLVR